MKRIKAAYLLQTIHFMLTEGYPVESEKEKARKDYEAYKASLERRGTQYKIMEETVQPDGSIIVKIKKQNNDQPVGDYFD